MNSKEIVMKLDGVVVTTNGWQALCPAHNDVKPSLSVGTDDGKILMHCHAGCTTERVLDALGLRMSDLFANGAQPAPPVTYDYTDENGEMLYQIIRRHPKGFSARRPDGNGSWINGLEGVRRVPYRLPDILERTKVFIVEGEKDVNTLHDKLRLAGTTNVFGAGKWSDEYNQFFVGKTVYLIPDADEAGEMHMRSVAASLLGIAKIIKILRLPFGKDVTEWYSLGGTRKELSKLAHATAVVTAEQAREWQKPAAATNGLQFKPLAELMRQPTEKRRWVVDGLLPTAGTSLSAGKPKVGKSTFARCLGFAVSRGNDFLGRKTNQGTVLYLAPQELEDEVKDHFKRLGATGSEPIYVCCRIDSNSALDDLERLIEFYKPALVIIDQLFHVLNIHSELSYAEVTKALQRIERLARTSGAHIFMTYHMGKSERLDSADQVLGTTAFFAGVDTLLMLERTQRFRTIESRQRYKGSQGDLPETVIAYDEARGAVTLGASRDQAEEGRIAEEIVTFLGAHGRKQFVEDVLLSKVNGGNAEKRSALRTLHQERRIARSGRGVKGDPYMYSAMRKMPAEF